MNVRIIIGLFLLITGITLIGVGAGLDIFPALVAGILLVGIGGAFYVISLFHIGSALPRNIRPVIVV